LVGVDAVVGPVVGDPHQDGDGAVRRRRRQAEARLRGAPRQPVHWEGGERGTTLQGSAEWGSLNPKKGVPCFW